MSYAQLKAFHAVPLNGGFSKAAERLALTQPAISDHIRKLEEAYGAELFVRRRGGVELTPFARKLFAITERHVRGGEPRRSSSCCAGRKGLEEGSLAIGADAAIHVLPLIRRFRERYPKIAVRLIAGNSAELLDKLDRFEIDFAVIAEPPPPQAMTRRLLRDDAIVGLHRGDSSFRQAR